MSRGPQQRQLDGHGVEQHHPGSGAAAGCAKGVVINEFSDAAGTNNFVYEFIKLHNDQ